MTILLLVLLAACASTPRTVEVGYDELQQALSRRFPLNERFLELVELQATGPTLQLLPEANRLRVDMSIAASERLLRNRVQGMFAISFAPRYQASDGTLRMGDVRVERLELPAAVPLQRLGPQLAEKVLEGAVLHTFRREDGFVPGEIRVTRRGLSMTLLPPVR